MEIQVLTFDGCPNCRAVRDLVEETIRDLHIQADLVAIQVQDQEEAERRRFLGSPTIQINGRDIEPRRRSDQASFSCRVYGTPGALTGVPPRQMIVDAIREAMSSAS